MISKEDLIDYLQPYFQADILTDIIYTHDEFCIFNFADRRYIAFSCILTSQNYPIGFEMAQEDVKYVVENPHEFQYILKGVIEKKYDHIYHFSKKNFEVYEKYINEQKHNIESTNDPSFIEEIKSKYMGKTK